MGWNHQLAIIDHPQRVFFTTTYHRVKPKGLTALRLFGRLSRYIKVSPMTNSLRQSLKGVSKRQRRVNQRSNCQRKLWKTGTCLWQKYKRRSPVRRTLSLHWTTWTQSKPSSCGKSSKPQEKQQARRKPSRTWRKVLDKCQGRESCWGRVYLPTMNGWFFMVRLVGIYTMVPWMGYEMLVEIFIASLI